MPGKQGAERFLFVFLFLFLLILILILILLTPPPAILNAKRPGPMHDLRVTCPGAFGPRLTGDQSFARPIALTMLLPLIQLNAP